MLPKSLSCASSGPCQRSTIPTRSCVGQRVAQPIVVLTKGSLVKLSFPTHTLQISAFILSWVRILRFKTHQKYVLCQPPFGRTLGPLDRQCGQALVKYHDPQGVSHVLKLSTTPLGLSRTSSDLRAGTSSSKFGQSRCEQPVDRKSAPPTQSRCLWATLDFNELCDGHANCRGRLKS